MAIANSCGTAALHADRQFIERQHLSEQKVCFSQISTGALVKRINKSK